MRGRSSRSLYFTNLDSIKIGACSFTYIAAAMYYTGTRTEWSAKSHSGSLHLLLV